MNWSVLTREFSGFRSTTPEELEDGLNYLASRYVSAQDKLERNYSGEELAAQAVRDSFSDLLAGKADAYRSALGQVHEAVEQPGPDRSPRTTGRRSLGRPPADGMRRRWRWACLWQT